MMVLIRYLVREEYRPFSYLDFIRFEVDGQEYRMAHGTFRNNVSRLMTEGLIEVSYKSNIAFYTLRGIKFNKASWMAMTGNHPGVPIALSSSSLTRSSTPSSNPLYRIVRDLPLDKKSVHDIHLRFASPRIYATTSSSISTKALGYDHTVNSKSKDILLSVWKIRDLLVKATIHRTDTVSVVIGCSLNPVVLDINGIIRLTNALSIVEERLSRVVMGSRRTESSSIMGDINSSGERHRDRDTITVPAHSDWTVIMWHFGADALVEYSGEKFSVTWETAENVLIRAYSKEMNDKRGTRIRLERQEYPKATLADLIEQKINQNQRSGG
jgi:hypothetical protein